MAVGVVVELELVQVENPDAERSAVAIGARELSTELLVPGSAVEEAGQVVGPGSNLEPTEELAALDRDGRLERQQPHRAPRLPAQLLERLAPVDGEHADRRALLAEDGLPERRARLKAGHELLGCFVATHGGEAVGRGGEGLDRSRAGRDERNGDALDIGARDRGRLQRIAGVGRPPQHRRGCLSRSDRGRADCPADRPRIALGGELPRHLADGLEVRRPPCRGIGLVAKPSRQRIDQQAGDQDAAHRHHPPRDRRRPVQLGEHPTVRGPDRGHLDETPSEAEEEECVDPDPEVPDRVVAARIVAVVDRAGDDRRPGEHDDRQRPGGQPVPQADHGGARDERENHIAPQIGRVVFARMGQQQREAADRCPGEEEPAEHGGHGARRLEFAAGDPYFQRPFAGLHGVNIEHGPRRVIRN
jgi:hypothetical protein